MRSTRAVHEKGVRIRIHGDRPPPERSLDFRGAGPDVGAKVEEGGVFRAFFLLPARPRTGSAQQAFGEPARLEHPHLARTVHEPARHVQLLGGGRGVVEKG